MRTTTAASAAVTSRLSEITGSQRGEEDRAHEEGDDQDPGRPVDLALQAAAGAGTAPSPLAATAHRPAESSMAPGLGPDARRPGGPHPVLRDRPLRCHLHHS